MSIKRKPSCYELIKLTPIIIRDGDARLIEPRKLVFLYSMIEDLGRPYKTIVKATGDGKQVFFESTYRIQKSQIQKTLNETTLVEKY